MYAGKLRIGKAIYMFQPALAKKLPFLIIHAGPVLKRLHRIAGQKDTQPDTVIPSKCLLDVQQGCNIKVRVVTVVFKPTFPST